MNNDLFKIGPLTVHGYGVMIAAGVLCAYLTAHIRAKKRNIDTDFLFSLMIMTLIFGFIGAKLLFCIVELKAVLKNPAEILSGGGFVVYGGIIGGVFAAYIACRIKNKNFIEYFDLMIPSVALAQGFGRIGCFLAGCCYGAETDSAIGIIFHNSDFAPNGVKLIPTQLLSAAGDFLIFGLLLLYAGKPRERGKVGGLYMILYGIGRFIIEYFRGDVRGSVGSLSTSQFISIIIFALGFILFFFSGRLIKTRGSDEN
jgi:phosphatidylglycerol:prolipoprotein diacylglycerol transferase